MFDIIKYNYSITCKMSNVYNYPSLPSSSWSMYNVYNMHKYTHIIQPIYNVWHYKDNMHNV